MPSFPMNFSQTSGGGGGRWNESGYLSFGDIAKRKLEKEYRNKQVQELVANAQATRYRDPMDLLKRIRFGMSLTEAQIAQHNVATGQNPRNAPKPKFTDIFGFKYVKNFGVFK